MKKKSLLILGILITCMPYLYSQSNLVISLNGGGQNVYDVNTIQKITFPEGGLSLNNTNGTKIDYSFEEIGRFALVDKVTSIVEEPISSYETYPNPFADYLHVSFELSVASMVNIEVFKTDGMIVHKEIIPAIAGVNTYELPNAASYKSGTYLVRIKSVNKVETLKLIKL